MHTHNQYIRVSYLEDDGLGEESVFLRQQAKEVSVGEMAFLAKSICKEILRCLSATNCHQYSAQFV
jgi:hypothetical protein